MADDNRAFLQRLVSLLAPEFDVVATAADGKSALEVINLYKPDLVLLDLEMPVLNGIKVIRRLGKNRPPAVICSVETDPEVVETARQAGALAYVFKIRAEKDLVAALRSVLQGKPFVSPGPG